MKDQKRRGHFFSKKHNPNACHFGWQQLASRSIRSARNKRGRHFSCTRQTNLPGRRHARRGGDVFLQKQNPFVYRPDFRYPMNSGRKMLGRRRRFFRNPPRTSLIRGPTTTRNTKDLGKHFSFLTLKGTSKDAQNEAPRRCTQTSISKDAQNEAPRRMHTNKHLEGCTKQSTPKDAHKQASRRMHKTKHLERYTQTSISKDTHKQAPNYHEYKFRQPKEPFKVEGYNESRPDQPKYSTTLAPG